MKLPDLLAAAAPGALRTLFGALLGKRLPTYAGELRVSGAHAPITIRRDAYAVPHVSAESEDDVWFGLGYALGQDRAGQLEVFVRVVRGTLAEAIGPDGLAIDRLSRRIGFRRAAAAQLLASTPAIRAQWEAFARGINEGRARGGPKVAHDFVLLGCDPSPIIGADLAGINTFLAFALASNWDAELARFCVLEEDGPRALELLESSYLPEHPVTHEGFGGSVREAARALEDDLGALRSMGLVGGGSNAWAVAGTGTASGKPIVAGDPHLPPALPNPWYLARATTPLWSAAGAMFVGLPGFVAGHNGYAAWGVTAAHGDNTDWFVEEIGDDEASLREGDRFVPCEVRTEVIKVKGAADVVERVLVGPRGPIVSPTLDRARPKHPRRALSMAATWLSPSAYEGFLKMHLVRSPQAFREAFRANTTSGCCVVYGDEDGRIAYQLSMSTPIRKKGNGTLPLAGWDPSAGWRDERVPLEALPFGEKKDGHFVLANHAPTAATEPFLGADFLDGFRGVILEEMLAARSDWDVARTAELQRDTTSVPWRELRGPVLGLRTEGREAREAQSILAAWDGRMDEGSEGASLFAAWTVELEGDFVRAVAPNGGDLVLGQGAHAILPRTSLVTRRMRHLVRVVRERPEGVFAEGWDRALEGSLARALAKLRARGATTGTTAWGAVRPVRLVHPFGEKGLSAIYDRGPLAIPGDATTIAQGAVDFLDAFANSVGVPVFRMIVPIGAWDDARFALLGGESGNPLSPHYDDQIEPWGKGGFALAYSEPAIARTTVHTLKLVPS